MNGGIYSTGNEIVDENAKLNISVMDLPYGVTMEYRNGLGIVLNYGDKPYHFNLPEGTKTLIGTTDIPTAGVLVFATKQ